VKNEIRTERRAEMPCPCADQLHEKTEIVMKKIRKNDFKPVSASAVEAQGCMIKWRVPADGAFCGSVDDNQWCELKIHHQD
jgi:hypothetical protein